MQVCATPFSASEFFKDMPWLNVSHERQATFIPPEYPKGGLLGGSSNDAPKMSKLQALAAARKKKAQEQKGAALEVEKPMANLSLGPVEEQKPDAAVKRTAESADGLTPKQRGFPLRKRKDSNPHEKVSKQQPSSRDVVVSENSRLDASSVYQAPPSAFASTMFQTAEPRPGPPLDNKFTMPYISNPIAMPANPFAGPSPDDVVMAAQSKGSTHSAKSKSRD